MSRKEAHDKFDRVWNIINVMACGTGSVLLLLATSSTFDTTVRGKTVETIAGAILFATFVVRVGRLIWLERK